MSWSYVLYDGRAYTDIDGALVISVGETLDGELAVAKDFDDWVLFRERTDENHQLAERVWVTSSVQWRNNERDKSN